MSEFDRAFPHSTKVHVEGPQDVRVPMREIALSGGEPPLRVYDTSGPEGHDVTVGLPKLSRWGDAPIEMGDASENGRYADSRTALIFPYV
jgi:hypothetical protein